MRLGFEITLQGGESVTTTAVVADFIAWEKQTGKSTSEFTKSFGVTDMAILAWSALKREQKTTEKFDDWILSVEEIGMREDAPKSTKKAP